MNELMMSMMGIAKGNPGALKCLMGLIEDPTKAVAGITILTKCEELDIAGTDFYVLWSDLANKNYEQMAKICEKVPPRVLKDACSRQDYSGRTMIAQFIV